MGARGWDQGWDHATVASSNVDILVCCTAFRAGRTPVDEALARDYTVSAGGWGPWHFADTVSFYR